jgi:steroid delta-isomerase-like uncharacterized protein
VNSDFIKSRFSESELANIAVIREWFKQVYNEKKSEIIEELLSSDFVFHYEKETVQGAKLWKEKFYDPYTKAIPDVQLNIEDIIASGDFVILRWVAHGTHTGEILGVKPSGKQVAIKGMSWIKVLNGKLVETWSSWNLSYFLRELLLEVKALNGILPTCQYCKSIRKPGSEEKESSSWLPIETYIQKHSEARFSHGVCPDCLRKHFGKDVQEVYFGDKEQSQTSGPEAEQPPECDK